jgi:hypothetical protein
MKVSDFSVLLLHLVRNDSAAGLFGSLSAISAVVTYFGGELSALIELLERTMATGVLSIQELSFSILTTAVERFSDQVHLLTNIVVGHVLRFVVADQSSVRSHALKCVIRFLFLVRADAVCCASIFDMLYSSFTTAEGENRNLAVVGFSALAYRFQENAAAYIARVLPSVWALCHACDSADTRTQPIAIETIAYFIRFVPSVCENFVGSAVQLFLTELESGNRQQLRSVFCALKSVSKCRRTEIIPFVGRIFERINALLTVSTAEKESIDESGLRYSDLHSAGLKLARRLICQLGGIEGLDSFLAALIQYVPNAAFWECELEMMSALRTCCFHSVPFLHSVFNAIHSDQQVWTFIAELIFSRETLDTRDIQILCDLCCEWACAGEYAALRPLAMLLRRSPGAFPIDFVLSLFENARSRLITADLCEFVDIFGVCFELTLLESCDASVSREIMQISLELMKECISCSVPPSSIRFLHSLLISGFEFDRSSLTSFLRLFAGIIQNPKHISAFWEDTMVEIFRVVLSLISHCPQFVYDWELFFAALPTIVPLHASLSVRDLYLTLAHISSSSALHSIANARFYIFTFLTRTLSLGAPALDRTVTILISSAISAFLRDSPGWCEALPQSFTVPSITCD